MMRLIVMAILLGLLTACGTAGMKPSGQLVRQAIALQMSLTQQQLTQQLQPSDSPQPPKFQIKRVAIAQQEPLVIQNLPTYHIWGTYDVALQLPKRQVTQKQNPFEVYLQRQQEGKTWRLALPQFTGKDPNPTWLTYLISSTEMKP